MAPHENDSDTTSVVILSTINVCTFMIGIFLHVRIIIVSKHEKSLTWKLDVTNSALSIAHFTHCIFLYAVTYAVEDLYTYTGVWYCYVAKELRHYGFLYISSNQHQSIFRLSQSIAFFGLLNHSASSHHLKGFFLFAHAMMIRYLKPGAIWHQAILPF